jgi:hypothetical protein
LLAHTFGVGGTPIHQSRVFLEALFSGKPAELYVLVWTLREGRKRSRWFLDVQQAVAYADSLRGHNVYVGIGLSPSDFGEFNRCMSENVAGIVGLCADIDLESDAHPSGARPTTIEHALSILPPEFPPSIIIETGNGIQVWWLFKEPWIFGAVAERQQAAAIAVRWQTLLKYAAQRRGWAFERLGDLARVLRVPGTQNVKDPANPKAVIIRTASDNRYNPSDFHDFLDDQSIFAEGDQDQQLEKWAQRFTDKPPLISMEAVIPADLLARWMEQDARFRSTWNHERADMSDVSQSGYDLALACFGVRNGLAEQQIVDLIIQDRRLRGEKQSKQLEYYRRTISKARSRVSNPSRIADGKPTSDPGNSTPPRVPLRHPDDRTPTTGQSSVDPNQKAKLCDQISAILGVQILRIEKLKGSEPVYLMETGRGCIEFPTVGKMMAYKSVREAFAANAGIVIRKFSPKEWDQIVQTMLDACVEKEGTDDLEFKGAALSYIDRYLADCPPFASFEGLGGSSQLSPVIHEGRIAISSTDLRLWINRTTLENLSVKHVAAMISVLGGEPVRLRRRGFREQSRWALPVNEFDPKHYSAEAGEHTNEQ